MSWKRSHGERRIQVGYDSPRRLQFLRSEAWMGLHISMEGNLGVERAEHGSSGSLRPKENWKPSRLVLRITLQQYNHNFDPQPNSIAQMMKRHPNFYFVFKKHTQEYNERIGKEWSQKSAVMHQTSNYILSLCPIHMRVAFKEGHKLSFQNFLEVPAPVGPLNLDFYFFLLYFQMNKLLLLCLLASLAVGNLVGLNTACPEHSVPDINKVCISPDYIEGCMQYRNVQQCAVCAPEYEPLDGKCNILDSYAQSPPTNMGCLQPSADGSCSNCANGYIKSSGSCLLGVKNCDSYNSDNTCKQCIPEYSLIFGECKHNYLLGCKVEQADHTCSECHKPFVLENYQCTVKQCKSYNDFGCISCECGYYLTENRACQKMVQGCLKYYRGVCVECLPHYKLKGGSCVIDGCQEYENQHCRACGKDYELVEGRCNFKDCLEWENDSCSLCKEGFNLYQGKCQPSAGNFVCTG